MTRSMNRMRISTTVDADCLIRARALGDSRDSELFDKALRAYIELTTAESEQAALERFPYELDPSLEMPEVDDDLPYDGAVPAHVLQLAKQRRRRQTGR